MNLFSELTSQMVQLPAGVAALGGLILFVLGSTLIAGGVHCWVRWRKLTK